MAMKLAWFDTITTPKCLYLHLLITLKAIHMEVCPKLMILVVSEEVMAEVMVATICRLVEVVVTVVLEEVAVEAGLLTSSVKSASSMVTLLMCSTFVLI